MERRDYPASSNIASLTYDPETQELTAVFKGDKAYAYAGIEAGVWEQLRDVKGSVGALFAHLVRGGGYPFTKVDSVNLPETSVSTPSTSAEAPVSRPKRPRTRTIRKLGV